MKICYFTATGNCLYVARRIGATGAELLSIPQQMKQESLRIEDEAVGIVCPVYAAEMPMMVRDFLNRADIRTDYLFFVYTFGMGYGSAFDHVELIARERGWDLKYANAVQMVDNYLPGFEMQHQMDTLPSKDVEGQLNALCTDIAARREHRVKITAKSRAEMAMYSKMLAKRVLHKDAAKGYIVTDACTHCGTCARVCPANNITVTETDVSFADRCEVCYACLHACPENALHTAGEKSAVRFRNEHVSLRDIIAANE